MCKDMLVILVNDVNKCKKWAEEEERHKGSLTPPPQKNGLNAKLAINMGRRVGLIKSLNFGAFNFYLEYFVVGLDGFS
jgi:hypothetical protein